MPPRRSTPRKGRSDTPSSSAAGTPSRAASGSPASATGTPRRTRGRPRAQAKAEDSESPRTEAATEPSSEKKRGTRGSKAGAAAKRDAVDRVHKLPTRVNPRLEEVKTRQVKLQVIRREDKEIIIGRIKLPTVNGAEHGFLLKRFDTNAIAGSSMFRLAFPYADAEAERAEMAYLESRFDTDVANGGLLPAPAKRGRKAEADSPARAAGGVLPPNSSGVRLQGVWIPCDEAAAIAEDYGLLEIAQPLLDATAVLLPDQEAPVLNPDAETVARAAEGAAARAESAGTAPVTPSRQTKRARTQRAEAEEAPAATETPSPRTRRGTPRRTRGAPSEGLDVGLSPAQVDAQIKAAKHLAAEIQGETPAGSKRSTRKRRAEDDEEVAVAPQARASGLLHGPGAAVHVLRSNARQHPVATRTAGVLTAAGAVGAAAAWYAGALDLSSAVQQLQHIDYHSALQAIQSNVASWNVASWFG